MAGLFEIRKNTDIRLKFIKIDNSLHRLIIVILKVILNERNVKFQNSAKKMPKNMIINIKQQGSKGQIFGFYPCNIAPPPPDP